MKNYHEIPFFVHKICYNITEKGDVFMLINDLEKYKGKTVKIFYLNGDYDIGVFEYIDSSNNSISLIDSYHTFNPMPFHQMALDLYNDYLVTGGMPEVVKAYFEHEDFYKLEAIKQKIIISAGIWMSKKITANLSL